MQLGMTEQKFGFRSLVGIFESIAQAVGELFEISEWPRAQCDLGDPVTVFINFIEGVDEIVFPHGVQLGNFHVLLKHVV